jgi:hypothetical protein
MSKQSPTDDPAAISPFEVAALAAEMKSAGFPEIASILIELAYELADGTETLEGDERIVAGEWLAAERVGWLRA